MQYLPLPCLIPLPHSSMDSLRFERLRKMVGNEDYSVRLLMYWNLPRSIKIRRVRYYQTLNSQKKRVNFPQNRVKNVFNL